MGVIPCPHLCCHKPATEAHQHTDPPIACPECDTLHSYEAAANLLSERMAEAAPETVERVLGVPRDEPVDVVRAALLADVEPMSWTGRALFILAALDAGGYEVTKKSERPRASDRSGGASGSAAVDAPPATPRDLWCASCQRWTDHYDHDPGSTGRTSTGLAPAGTDPAPGPSVERVT